ncbi:hypothetical protein KIW84_012998 [Lathyrus oleraceus]|uniref:URB1 C-terminal domain-containing protein n=1 Tax=Pisum sativum TaxID=3888 RepID=A0A9D5BJE5_PEA|nr:hypothetical protein KIW84_012998 [Pisum sativum]
MHSSFHDHSIWSFVVGLSTTSHFPATAILSYSSSCTSVTDIPRPSRDLFTRPSIVPVEFAGSGLLAIAFVSMSSPNQGIRRLAYDTLLKYKNALEKCQKRKDVMRLRLLINSIQNSIEESWKRIPSVIALFVAEAPCLTELSSNLSSFVLHDVTMTDESVELVNPFLQMIVSVLKLSQKRKICQPHFTLSIEGLYQIYQAGSVCNQASKGINPNFALEAILMSPPPISIFLKKNYEKRLMMTQDAVSDTLKAGIDVECGDYLTKHAKSAMLQNKVPISQIHRALHNLFSIQIGLRLFDGNPTKLKCGTFDPNQDAQLRGRNSEQQQMIFPASQSHANSAFLLAAAARNSGWSISATMLPKTVKAQLLAFYRLKGYSYLPEFQYFRGLDDDINLSINDTDKRLSEVNEHIIHVGRIGDQTGTRDSNTAAQSSLVPVSQAAV